MGDPGDRPLIRGLAHVCFTVSDLQRSLDFYRHICLEVDDIEEAVRRLRERGVAVSDVKVGNDRSYQAWISDPDGNRIELHGYTPESKQAPYLR